MSKFDRITLSRRSMLVTAGALLASPRLPSAQPAGTVNILFDSWSTQVLYQQNPPNPLPICFRSRRILPGSEPKRLKTLFHTIDKMGWHKYFTEPPITPSQLNGKNVYVSLTRYFDPCLAYQTSELDAIQSWVKTGGNVLLMTNHGASGSLPNFTRNDKALAARFGVTLSDYFVGPRKDSLSLSYPKPCSNVIEPVLSMSVLPARYNLGVQSVWAHDSCIIRQTDPGTGNPVPVMEFPSNATQRHTTSRPVSPYFGLEVSYEMGKLLVLGNSGWVGEEHTCNPSPGLIHQADNLQFVMNCLAILGGVQPIKLQG